MFYLAQNSICGKERNFLFNNNIQISSKDHTDSDPVDTGVSLLGCHTSRWIGMMKIRHLEVSFTGPKYGFIEFTEYHLELDTNQTGSSRGVLWMERQICQT
jgi:hypothetical protein